MLIANMNVAMAMSGAINTTGASGSMMTPDTASLSQMSGLIGDLAQAISDHLDTVTGGVDLSAAGASSALTETTGVTGTTGMTGTTGTMMSSGYGSLGDAVYLLQILLQQIQTMSDTMGGSATTQ
jgi:hypothetical protein